MTAHKPGTATRRLPAALAMLVDDHRSVERLVRRFSLEKKRERRTGLARQLCAELSAHARLEEDVFYPALAEKLGEDAALLAEAGVEHAVIRQLVEALHAMRADHPLLGATIKVLGEYVAHHVQEEEKRIFAQARKVKIDFEALAEAMRERRQQLRLRFELEDDTPLVPEPPKRRAGPRAEAPGLTAV